MFLCSCLTHAGSFASTDTLTYWHTDINTSKYVQCTNGHELCSTISLKHWIQEVKCCTGKERSFIADAFSPHNLCNNMCCSGQLFAAEKWSLNIPIPSFFVWVCTLIVVLTLWYFFLSIRSAFLIEVHMQIWLFIRDSFRAWQISTKKKASFKCLQTDGSNYESHGNFFCPKTAVKWKECET